MHVARIGTPLIKGECVRLECSPGVEVQAADATDPEIIVGRLVREVVGRAVDSAEVLSMSLMGGEPRGIQMEDRAKQRLLLREERLLENKFFRFKKIR